MFRLIKLWSLALAITASSAFGQDGGPPVQMLDSSSAVLLAMCSQDRAILENEWNRDQSSNYILHSEEIGRLSATAHRLANKVNTEIMAIRQDVLLRPAVDTFLEHPEYYYGAAGRGLRARLIEVNRRFQIGFEGVDCSAGAHFQNGYCDSELPLRRRFLRWEQAHHYSQDPLLFRFLTDDSSAAPLDLALDAGIYELRPNNCGNYRCSGGGLEPTYVEIGITQHILLRDILTVPLLNPDVLLENRLLERMRGADRILPIPRDLYVKALIGQRCRRVLGLDRPYVYIQ